MSGARYRRLMALSALMLAGVVTACSTSSPGTPTPTQGGTTTATTSQQSGARTTPTSSSPAQGLTAEQLCQLVTAEETTALAATAKGTPGKFAGDPQCKWEKGPKVRINMIAYNGKALDELNLANQGARSPFSASGKSGYLFDNAGTGSCSVGLNIAQRSSVILDVGRTVNEPMDFCGIAKQLGNLIAPRLP